MDLESKNEELGLIVCNIEDLKQKYEYLENKVKCNEQIESIPRNQITELELKLKAYQNSANLAKELIDNQIIRTKTVI